MQLGRYRITLRHFVFLGGLVLLPPVLLLFGLAFSLPITSSGLGYAVGVVLFDLGALAALRRTRIAAALMSVGFLTMAAVAAVRINIGGEGTAVRLVTLPGETETRWIDRLIHERDLGLFGQEAAFFGGVGINRREHKGLPGALYEAYTAIAAAGGTTSSPVIATYLFLQRPAAFDAVVVDARQPDPQAAVIYLHGLGGNLTVQGWLVAQAAKRIDALTVAPSVGFLGNWWTPHGEATLRATIAYVRKRGVRRIYLAGLSNGGVGACRLAPKFDGDLAGLILISGADHGAVDAGLPVLAVYGKFDDRMPPHIGREYVRRAGDRGAYREFDGDHLLLAKRAADVQQTIGDWLIEHEAKAVQGGTP